MEEALISLLEEYGFEVFRQGSYGDEVYPDTFITFWNNGTEEIFWYDNACHGSSGSFDINVYSIDPNIAYTMLENVKEKLRQNGYIITDAGHDLASDEPTHIGRGITAVACMM